MKKMIVVLVTVVAVGAIATSALAATGVRTILAPIKKGPQVKAPTPAPTPQQIKARTFVPTLRR